MEPISATPKDDQYAAAVREAHELVQRDEFPFRLDEPGRPEALAQWAVRYAVERGDGRTSGALRFCAHPGEAQVRYTFGCEPNHSYCASCRYATGTWAMSRVDGRLPQRAPSATPLRDGVRPSGTARPVRPFVQATRFVRRPSGPGPAGSSSTDRADYRSSNMS
jgi:hypothetical protein